MLNRNSSRASLIEVHVHQTGIANAGGKSPCLSVSGEIAGQRIVHEPRSGAQRYVSRRVGSLAACFETFAERRHRCGCERNSQDYQSSRKSDQRFRNDSELRLFHMFLPFLCSGSPAVTRRTGGRTALMTFMVLDGSSPVALCRWGVRVIGSYCLYI